MLTIMLRTAMTLAHLARRLFWKASGGPPPGVHGLVLTPAGEVVLVRLTYGRGWHLPGGGLKRGEAPRDGVVRELREEIGLRTWAALHELSDPARGAGGQCGRNGVFVVHGAVHEPRRSLEIAEVRAFDPADLPPDTGRWTRAIVEAVTPSGPA